MQILPFFAYQQIPDVPTLTAPTNAATSQDTNHLAHTWTASTPHTATTYQIQIDDNSNFASPFKDSSGITGVSATFSGLASNTVYYWRVRATTTAGSSA